MKTLILALLISAPNFEVISIDDAAIRVAMYKVCVAHYSINDPTSMAKLRWYTDVVDEILTIAKNINTGEAYQQMNEQSEYILHQIIHSPQFKLVGQYCDATYDEVHVISTVTI